MKLSRTERRLRQTPWPFVRIDEVKGSRMLDGRAVMDGMPIGRGWEGQPKVERQLIRMDGGMMGFSCGERRNERLPNDATGLHECKVSLNGLETSTKPIPNANRSSRSQVEGMREGFI